MENADIANDLLLILKMSDVACQLNFNIKKIPTQIKKIKNKISEFDQSSIQFSKF